MDSETEHDQEPQEEQQHHKDEDRVSDSTTSPTTTTPTNQVDKEEQRSPTTMPPNTENKDPISPSETSTSSRSQVPTFKKAKPPLPAEKLSGLDTFFCVIERPENLMNIAGLWEFESAPELQKIREELELMVERFPRFRQHIVRQPFGSIWFEDYDFNLDDHIVVEDLPENCDQETYRLEISRISSLSLDESKVDLVFALHESSLDLRCI